MGRLVIHQEKVTREIAEKMCGICPFNALSYHDGILEIDAGCRVCRLCVKNGIPGLITWEESEEKKVDKSDWKGIAVFAEQEGKKIHPVTYELLGKARELAEIVSQPVYAVVAGYDMEDEAEELMHYGTNKIYYYENVALNEYAPVSYTAVLEDFIHEVHPSVMLFGATVKGRSLAPRTAARFHTGLTADCTALSMKQNSDLVQIRPAFGGNIMAQIITPNARPQFCTVRYKVFSKAFRTENPGGKLIIRKIPDHRIKTGIKLLDKTVKPKQIDISEAEIIVAAGRGVRDKKGMALVQELAGLLHAQTACTRPLVESGWFDARRQIGLSGRTVKPKLLIALGISGAVQFAAGMKGADCIIAVNSDRNAAIFDIAHYGFVGDLYEILPEVLSMIKGGEK